MEILKHINYFAVVILTIIYFFIGFIWYRPWLFGTIWLKEKGIIVKKSPIPMTVTATVIQFGGMIITQLLYCIGIAIILQFSGKTGFLDGIITGIMVIIFFVIPMNAATLFFPPKPKMFFIDLGYQTTSTLIIAIILSIWK